jgi:hypothetical protein
VRDLLRYMREQGLTRIDARREGVKEWMKAVEKAAEGLLSNEVNSWFTGINTNVEGKQVRRLSRYSGSAPAYRAHCDALAAGGYREMDLR